MKAVKNLKAEASIFINSTEAKIWDVLTNPDKIKLFMFGSNVKTDWGIGNPIFFNRDRLYPSAPVLEKPIVDKGKILQIINGKLLKFSFYNSMEGYEDIPENYSIVTYSIEEVDKGRFRLNYLRELIPIDFERENQERFLPGMMKQLKSLAEA